MLFCSRLASLHPSQMSSTAIKTGKALIYEVSCGTNYRWVTSYQTPKLGSKDVLLKVISGGLNPIDYKLPTMGPAWLLFKGKPVGQDVCGRVLSVGSGVDSLAVGDTVFGWGPACSEFTVTSSNMLVKVPSPSPVDIASFGGLGGASCTAYQGLKLAKTFEGSEPKKILIVGASGGVGSSAVQIARALAPKGSEIIGLCSGKSSEYVQSLGATGTVDYSRSGFKLVESIEPGSVDVVFDTVSSPEDFNYIPEGMKLLKPGIGQYVSTNTPSKIDLVRSLFTRFTGIRSFGGQYRLMSMLQERADLEAVADLVQQGKLKINIDSYVAFEEAGIRDALSRLEGRHVRGKLVVKVET
jgi:NADPH:quinone reductase-like Zn-dependent oxidoreductase